MSDRRPYVRPMPRDWWARRPFRHYTIRELSGVTIAIYAAVLLSGLVALLQGPAAWEIWRGWLASPASLVLHAVLLVAMIWHLRTWFQILPKTMPKLVVGGSPVPQRLITLIGTSVAIVCSTALVAFVLWRPF
ncbi:fumarate reductase subunit C [Rhodomicrobium lacus]|uniref:fumarate reductase subunit C n=1 Tax=Rhodomicrobium lacus TaxID=2498452 RepID=UPI000F8C4DDF|nr:fumarate reductase subunit C [Rhodomicrobium lacus]